MFLHKCIAWKMYLTCEKNYVSFSDGFEINLSEITGIYSLT